MLFCEIFLVVALLSFRRDLRVSSCDESCADRPVFTPSSLVVKFGDPSAANCSVCQHACLNTFVGLEVPVGVKTEVGTTILWSVDSFTEWDMSVLCFYNSNTSGDQCCTPLPVTVYQPPADVSISFVDHSGPMLEGGQYTLQCAVQDVAPAGNLTVTFFSGRTVLGQLWSNSTEKKPVTESFTLNINPSKEDDGVQYWCEAKLELGPEGPQRPPVVTSSNITATVYYVPQFEAPPADPITIPEGDMLQLNCLAVGNPSPSYEWRLPSARPHPPNSSVLIIESVAVEHKGSYRCVARNTMGTVTLTFNVDVQVSNTIPIIVGIIAAAVVVLIVGVLCYRLYHNYKRTDEYNLLDVFWFHKKHSTLPTA